MTFSRPLRVSRNLPEAGSLMRQRFVCLFAAGTVAAFLYWMLNPQIAAGGEAYALALSLAQHGAFANPFFRTGLTGPSAHMAPLWPLTVAVIMRAFGGWFIAALLVMALLASGLNAALLPLLSERFFGTARPGLYAALAVITLPVYELCPAWDAMYSADLLMLCMLVRGRHPAVFGSLTGLLFLFNPVAGLVLAILLLWRGSFTVRSAAVFVLVLLPWTLRNYHEFHQFVPLRDDLGIALYSSNNPCAQPTLEANTANGCHQQTHPVNSVAENRMVAQMGEVAYNKMRLHTAQAWIANNPRAFWLLTAKRFAYFWFPWQRPAVFFISALGCAGLALLLWRRRTTGLMFLCALAAGSTLYYFVEAQERYRFPVYWCMCLCAGYLLCPRKTDPITVPVPNARLVSNSPPHVPSDGTTEQPERPRSQTSPRPATSSHLSRRCQRSKGKAESPAPSAKPAFHRPPARCRRTGWPSAVPTPAGGTNTPVARSDTCFVSLIDSSIASA